MCGELVQKVLMLSDVVKILQQLVEFDRVKLL